MLFHLSSSLKYHFFINLQDEMCFLVSVFYSLSLTLILAYLAKLYLPLSAIYIPVWLLYAFICGTAATGLWVLGHECVRNLNSKYYRVMAPLVKIKLKTMF